MTYTIPELRSNLIDIIWSGEGYPTKGADNIIIDVANPLSVDAMSDNIERTDKLEFHVLDKYADLLAFPPGFSGTVYCWLWRPIVSNGKLILWCSGHSPDVNASSNGNLAARDFLTAGYTVAWCVMPGETVSATEHTNTFPAPTPELNMLRAFVECPIRAINQLGGAFSQICLYGHSGGGWCTSLVAAIETRIDKSWINAGSQPMMCANARDFEQQLPGIFPLCDYHDLYVMGCSDGRAQRQTGNVNDACCFHRAAYVTVNAIPYHWPVKQRAKELGGDWDLIWDKKGGHEVTEATRTLMLDFAEGREYKIVSHTGDLDLSVGEEFTLEAQLSFNEGEYGWYVYDEDESSWVEFGPPGELSVTANAEAGIKQYKFVSLRATMTYETRVITVDAWEPSGLMSKVSSSCVMYTEMLAEGTGTIANVGDRVGTIIDAASNSRWVAVGTNSRPLLTDQGIRGDGNDRLYGYGEVLNAIDQASSLAIAFECDSTPAQSTICAIQEQTSGSGAFIFRIGGPYMSMTGKSSNSTAARTNSLSNATDRTGQRIKVVAICDYANKKMMVWVNGVLEMDHTWAFPTPVTDAGPAAVFALFASITGNTPINGVIENFHVFKNLSYQEGEKLIKWYDLNA